jgi:hypothetical protein
MINAQRLIGEIRRELVEQEIRRHPCLSALEAGRVRQEDLTHFAGEQHHIIRSDLRSVALLVNRFGTTSSGPAVLPGGAGRGGGGARGLRGRLRTVIV